MKRLYHPTPNIWRPSSAMSASPVPFRIKNVYGGLAEAEGLAWLDGSDLVLEYRVKDFTGTLSSSIREERLAVRNLEEVRLTEKFLRAPRLEVQARSMSAIDRVPQTQGAITLCVAKKDRERARQLARRLTMAVSEHKLKWLERESRRLGQ